MRFKLFKSVSNVLISSLVVLFEVGENLRYTKIPHKALLPYMRCTSGLDSRMNVIESAFESSDAILFDHKKFSNIRTHPEELRVLKSKFYLKLYEFKSIFYFLRRVVLQDEFLCY